MKCPECRGVVFEELENPSFYNYFFCSTICKERFKLYIEQLANEITRRYS